MFPRNYQVVMGGGRFNVGKHNIVIVLQKIQILIKKISKGNKNVKSDFTPEQQRGLTISMRIFFCRKNYLASNIL